MTYSDEHNPSNDNRLRLVTNSVDIDTVSDHMNTALDELSQLGADDAALIEVLMKSITEIALHSNDGPSDDQTGRHALGRYNQLSRLSGELEGIKAILMRDWCDRLSKPQS